jgi:hypothetical protein
VALDEPRDEGAPDGVPEEEAPGDLPPDGLAPDEVLVVSPPAERARGALALHEEPGEAALDD